jgi:hypothetical protein
MKELSLCHSNSQGTSLVGKEQIRNSDYCAIRWEDNDGVSIVQQSAVRKPSDMIYLFEQSAIERDNRYCNCEIILKGNKKIKNVMVNSILHNHLNE